MSDSVEVLLSGFADEAVSDKNATAQMCTMAALGLRYMTLRFIDVGQGVKNVMLLEKSELALVRKMASDYGLSISSIGSPIGKVKLQDVADGTSNRYVPFKQYLQKDVKQACAQAHALDAKLIRGFSFYHPKGTDPGPHLAQAIDQVGKIAEVCDKEGLTFGLEVEANLVGQTGQLLGQMHRAIGSAALVLIFDGANLVCQGMTTQQVYEEYLAMKPGLGWLHIKDYRNPNPTGRKGHVDEESLKHFVPADQGDSGHEAILRDLKEELPKIERRMRRRGADGVFLDLEPHVKGGGQFGGYSGPDGLGIALRGLCRVLDYVQIPYRLKTYQELADHGSDHATVRRSARSTSR